ncbi:hypothetical protein ACU8NU_00485 [Rhizobium leguminosarum]
MTDVFDDGEHQDHSAAEIERLRACSRMMLLREWLALRRWNSEQAYHVLTGIDPETNIFLADYGPGVLRLRTLPGHTLPRDPIEMADFYQTLLQRFELVRQRLASIDDVGAKDPRQLIDACLDHRLAPPWLELAANDGHCADFLSDKARNWHSKKPPLRSREAARKKADIKNHRSHGAMWEAVAAFLEKETANGIPTNWRHFSSGKLNWSAVARDVELPKEISKNPERPGDYDLPALVSTIKKWFNSNNLD